MKFYVTFGQIHKHPCTNERMKDYWIEIYADNRVMAIGIICGKYKWEWSTIYERSAFDKKYFSGGCYEILGIKSEEDKFDDHLDKIYDKRKINREIERIGDNNNKLLPKE